MEGCSQLWNKMENRIATLEFDRDRKSMSVIVNSLSGKKTLLVKVYSLCPFKGLVVFEVFPPLVCNGLYGLFARLIMEMCHMGPALAAKKYYTSNLISSVAALNFRKPRKQQSELI